MRVLLDECVPRQLTRALAGFEVQTTQQMGWAGVKNGALVALAAGGFNALFTVDKDFGSAAAPAASRIGIVILVAGTT